MLINKIFYHNVPIIGSVDINFCQGQDFGCNYNQASNYQAGSKENGSCDVKCCAKQGHENYDATCSSKISTYNSILSSLGIVSIGTIDSNYNCGLKLGCTNQSASNFDSSAQKDDGSCHIVCNKCPTGTDQSNTDQACLDAQVAYQAMLNSQGTPLTGTISTTSNNCATLGCNLNSVHVSNYNGPAKENGKCNIACCSQEGFSGYDPTCQTTIDSYISLLGSLGLTSSGNINNSFECGKQLGCSYDQASNFQAGSQEDGSCDILCCKDPGTENYDPSCQGKIDNYLAMLAGLNLQPSGQIGVSCGPKLGCNFNNSFVTNFVSNSKEDGSCDISCCSTQGTENYDPNCQTAVNAYTTILSGLGLTANGTIDSTNNCGEPLGCAYNDAENFQANTKENGTCNINCCADSNSENFDPNCQTKIDTYNAILSGLGLSSLGTVSNDFNCGKVLGCSYEGASNSVDGAKENGSCDIECCATQGTENFDPNCQSKIDTYTTILVGLGLTSNGTISNSHNCGPSLGCAYDKASNYDSAAKENGSCIISCCATQGMANYDPNCQSTADTYSSILSGLGIQLIGSITTDACEPPKGCAYDKASNYNSMADEDGTCDIECCATQGTENFDPNCQSKIDVYTGILNGLGLSSTGTISNDHNCGLPLGCSYSDADNFEDNHKEDGSCTILCCATEGTENFDDTCRGKIDGYTALISGLGLPSTGSLEDNHNCGPKLGCADPNASNYVAGVKEDGSCDFNCCATEGTQNFDPSCQTEIDSYVSILTSLGLNQTGQFDNNFECGDVTGCMEELADNYNPNATADPDHVCIFSACQVEGSANFDDDEKIREAFANYGHGVLQPKDCGALPGCANPKAKNFEAGRNEDGSCIFEGCNQSNFGNFDPNFDSMIQQYMDLLAQNGITFTGQVNSNICEGLLGCTIPQAENYNNQATTDDGSCTFTGCTDPNAQNFDSALADIVSNYGISTVLTDGCQYNPHYSCLCNEDGTAGEFDSSDHSKAFVITDQTILDAFEAGHNGTSLHFGEVLGSVGGAQTSTGDTHNCEAGIYKSYVDGYKFSTTNKDSLSRPGEYAHIKNRWGVTAPNDLTLHWLNKGPDAPYELLAIVFRPDLVKKNAAGKVLSHGEIRLIYWLEEANQVTNVCNTSTSCNGSSRYRRSCSTSTNCTAQDKLNEDPNLVIFEYDLPGDFNWHYNFALLKCLEGDAYKDHLATLVEGSIFTKFFNYKECVNNTSSTTSRYGSGTNATTGVNECGHTRVPLSQIRVNSLAEMHTDPSAKWALFEYKPKKMSNGCFELARVKMPLTPVDIAARQRFSDPGIEIRQNNQLHNSSAKSTMQNSYVSQFNNIKDPFKSYSVPSNIMAFQNTYDLNVNWKPQLPSFFGSSTDRDHATFRYNMNTCNGCHASQLNQAGVNPTGQFMSINEPNDFVHIHKDGTLSPFLIEDLGYRSEDLELSLSNNFCSLGAAGYGTNGNINVSAFSCDIDFNNDGNLTSADFSIYQSRVSAYLAGQSCITVIDVDGDGQVGTAADATAFNNILGANGASFAGQFASACKDVTSTCGGSTFGSGCEGEATLLDSASRDTLTKDTSCSNDVLTFDKCPEGSIAFVHGSEIMCVCRDNTLATSTGCNLDSGDTDIRNPDGEFDQTSNEDIPNTSDTTCRDGFVFSTILGKCVEKR